MKKLFNFEDTFGYKLRIIGSSEPGTVVVEYEAYPDEFVLFPLEDIKKVQPWTFAVKYMTGPSYTAKEYHFVGDPEWDLEVGDILTQDKENNGLKSSAICIVTDVDTKCEYASKKFEGKHFKGDKI